MVAGKHQAPGRADLRRLPLRGEGARKRGEREGRGEGKGGEGREREQESERVIRRHLNRLAGYRQH